ncbi:capsid cement protein [uncultured Microbacterium sp.]|uniref:capsid cement protein n=1 Tax=uncultured Microbacterium sp. TaxID=191216 RepID=UPI0025F42634|nr:capsid cement protein [uncultured Microbacterium sp.]
MADHLPLFKPGQAVTFTATAAITGGQVVEVSGDRKVAPAGAASTKAIGTAGLDVASGDTLVVHLNGPVDTVVAAAAITAGAEVEAAALGQAQTRTTGRSLGIALTAATAAGQLVQVLRA